MLMVLVAGMGMMQGMAASNTIIQTLVSEDKRGRVMSYYTMAFVGMAPFGSLLAGTMAHAIPPTPVWIVAGMMLDRRAMDGDYQRSGGRARRGVVLHAAAGAARAWCGQFTRRWASFRPRRRWRRNRCNREKTAIRSQLSVWPSAM